MADIEAVYVDGESQLPQARPALAAEPVYGDGESGFLPIVAYVAVAGFKPYWARRSGSRILTPGVM